MILNMNISIKNLTFSVRAEIYLFNDQYKAGYFTGLVSLIIA